MDNNSLIDRIHSEITNSLQDELLASAEKKELKQLLIKLAPDKQTCDLLRSHVFELAQQQVDVSNYSSIIKWVEDLNKVILSSQREEKINERVYFSPGDACLNAITHQIRSAYQHLQICLFTISDNRISEELISRHKAGVRVKIITDNDKVFDSGSDIDMLFNAGIPVKVDITENHMHHKFALFDGKTTITGSYNWTRSAEKYNHENIVISDSALMVREFDKEFNKLWEECVFYDNI